MPERMRNVTSNPQTFEKRIHDEGRKVTFWECKPVESGDTTGEEKTWKISIGVGTQFYEETVTLPDRPDDQLFLQLPQSQEADTQAARIDIRTIITLHDRMNMLHLAAPDDWSDILPALTLFEQAMPPAPRPKGGRRKS